ncbi:MAG: ABC transporter permease subunit [Chloroflexota bacterium]
MSKIWVVVRKEWAEVFKNRFVLFAVIFMPLLFTAMPLGIMASMGGSADAEVVEMASGMEEYGMLCEGLTATACSQYFIISQFLILFLMLPLIIPVTIAAYSIVGEKTTRTLEPVLATPITTIELLSGKALAGIIPALGATWLSYGLFLVGTVFLAVTPEIVGLVAQLMWLVAIFVLGPLLSLAGVCLAIMVSSRVNDPRVAEQLSSLVIIPLLGIFMGQSFGLFQVNLNVVIWMVLAVAVLDAVLIYFAAQLFQRETILTRWK